MTKQLNWLAVPLLGILVFALFALCGIGSTPVSYALNTSAKAMCVIDQCTNRVLFAHNAHEQLPMASTTKVATAITVLENCADLDEIITVHDDAIGVEGTSIYLRKEEQISIRDLLYGLMLRSGNDSATALAYHIGGSVAGFAEKMNQMALKLGAKNTHFANPHGLDNPEHYTSAYDLALIAAHALKNPTFKEIVSTKMHIIPATNKSDKRYLANKNRLLSSLEGCCGVKTGYTSKAGRCLVSACERDMRTSVCVVLNCGPMFEESKTLLEDSFQTFETKKVIDKNKQIYNEYVTDEKSARLYLYPGEDLFCPIDTNGTDQVELKYHVRLDDAKEGAEVGKIELYLNNQLLNSVKLYTINKIDKFLDNKTLQIKEILWEEKLNENQ